MSILVKKILEDFSQGKSRIIHYQNIVLLQEYGTPLEYQYLSQNIHKCDSTMMVHIQAQWKELKKDKHSIERYQRFKFSKKLSLYKDKNFNTKKLIIAFCGKAQILFGPVAHVLQIFPSSEFDILVLRDSKKLGFTAGIEEFANNWSDLIVALSKFIKIEKYQEVYTIGTSGGGGPALSAAVSLNAIKGVSFSGKLSTSSKLYGSSATAKKMAETILNAKVKNQLYNIYPALNVVDAKNAKDMALSSQVNLLPIIDLENHNCLNYLLKNDALNSFFKDVGILGSTAK